MAMFNNQRVKIIHHNNDDDFPVISLQLILDVDDWM